MNKINRKMSLLAVCFICLLVAGCGERDNEKQRKLRNEKAWDACINSGGIPLQSWYNDSILSDCKFAHTGN